MTHFLHDILRQPDELQRNIWRGFRGLIAILFVFVPTLLKTSPGRCASRSCMMGMPKAPKTKRFSYSVICVLGWGAWVLFSKLGSDEISANSTQILCAFGFIPVALLVLILKPAKFEKSLEAIACSLGNGVLAGFGRLGRFAAYRTGGNTSVSTAATALYPVMTVVAAYLVPRERLTWPQVGSLRFAVVAIIIFYL